MVWPSPRNVAHELGEQREGIVERIEVRDLAADMHVDAGHLAAPATWRPWHRLARAADRNAELVLGPAGGDLVLGLGVDIGIDPHRNIRRRAPLAAAIDDSNSSSGSDSTLTQRMPSSTARPSSRAVLPMPENMILSAGTPAAARASARRPTPRRRRRRAWRASRSPPGWNSPSWRSRPARRTSAKAPANTL